MLYIPDRCVISKANEEPTIQAIKHCQNIEKYIQTLVVTVEMVTTMEIRTVFLEAETPYIDVVYQ